jgi:hypothetical protein
MVGKNPDPFADMWGSHVSRSQHSPFRIEPQRGQVSEYSSKPSTSEHWGVLHERESRSYLANNPSHFRPEPTSLAVESIPSAGNADVLAWEASRNDINNASPWSAVKGSHVIPNRERRECSVVLSGQ